MDDYQAEDDHRTLTRAQDIQDSPKRMRGVMKHHQKQKRALSKAGKLISGASKMGR